MDDKPRIRDPDQYDSPWKDVLEHAYPEFMAFYFPDAHDRIDWTREYTFLNTELRQVVRDAELGKRFADALVRVTLLGGEEQWIYIHIEIQGAHDPAFAQRMFVYNYRLYDRYERPIASFAVLADDEAGWRPNQFGYETLGCTHRLTFPVVKLLELDNDALDTHPNPFALVTAAHLRTRQTRHDPPARYQAKLALVRQLYQHGWDRRRILDLFAILDWMLRLPDALERKLWQDIEHIEGETRMRYVTSVERLAMERGVQQGIQQGVQQGIQQGVQQGIQQGVQQGIQQGKRQGETILLERQLAKRFGPINNETRQRLASAPTEQLEIWAERILDAPTIEAVFEVN